jgi:alkylhydroperoxidase family enzyme
MPFFELVPEEHLSPESRRLIEIAQKRSVEPNRSGARLLAMAGHPTLDGYCSTPANLPLAERDRLMVELTVRLACERSQVKPSDYRAMERAGFSKEDLLEMIGIAAFWNLATTIAMAMDTGLADE